MVFHNTNIICLHVVAFLVLWMVWIASYHMGSSFGAHATSGDGVVGMNLKKKWWQFPTILLTLFKKLIVTLNNLGNGSIQHLRIWHVMNNKYLTWLHNLNWNWFMNVILPHKILHWDSWLQNQKLFLPITNENHILIF